MKGKYCLCPCQFLTNKEIDYVCKILTIFLKFKWKYYIW